MKKNLIFSNYQNFNIKNKHNFFLGPWVFLGSDNIEKILSENFFKKTFSSKDSLSNSNYLIKLSSKIIKHISNKLNKYHNCNFSYEYWKILIGPAIIYYVQVLYEKYNLINSILDNEQTYECEIINTEKIPEFQSSRDVLIFLKSSIGNFFLTSLIIKEISSDKLNTKILNKDYSTEINSRPQFFLFDKMKVLIDLLISVYTNNFIHRIKGINFIDKLRIKNQKVTSDSENKINLIEKNLKLSKFTNLSIKNEKFKSSNLFEEICYKNVDEFLPKFIYQNFTNKNLKSIKLIKFFRLYEKKIILGPVLGGNDTIKFIIALLKDIKVSVNICQHGGYYGFTKTFTTMAFIEYLSSNKFITWGWRSHSNYKVNTYPLPSPLISKLNLTKNNHNIKNKLLFVGTDMPIIYERYGVTPQPQEFTIYQSDKKIIINNLSNNILLAYKPYSYNPSSLSDHNFLSNVKHDIVFLKTDFEKNINKYNLILLDHPGTIMNLCIGANKPVIIYINLSIWEFTNEIKYYLDELHQIGVVQYDINSCCKFINNLFIEDINSWWNLKKNQKKLNIFRNQFAMTSQNWHKQWGKFLNEQ